MIWDFGQTPNRWRAARARAVALGDNARATRLEAIADVRTAYFRASAQKSLVGVARQTLANRQRHLEQIRGFVHAGTAPDIDLAQAVADEANARVQVIRAENGYAVARAQLNQAMGIDRRHRLRGRRRHASRPSRARARARDRSSTRRSAPAPTWRRWRRRSARRS